MIYKMDWADTGSFMKSFNIKLHIFSKDEQLQRSVTPLSSGLLVYFVLNLSNSDFENFNTIFSLFKYQFLSCVVLKGNLL